MNQNLTTQIIGNGLNFNCVTDTKFKHNRLTVNFIVKAEREYATTSALIPFIMRQGCEMYPDFTKLNKRLAELYGAALATDVSKYGAYQVVDFSVQGIDSRFALNNEDMLRELSELLMSVVTKPLIVDGAFDESIAELEKQFLLDTIQAEINDKRGYAFMRCKEIMCKGEPIAVKKYGYEDEVMKITVKEAYERYNYILENAAVEIMLVGSAKPDIAIETIKKAFENIKRVPQQYPVIKADAFVKEIKDVTEVLEVNQSKLVLGFRTGEHKTERELIATRLLIALYGATATSKLFVNVREKMSLCYYCAARMDKLTGIMMVDCGVEQKNAEKAKAEILRQLDLCKAGEISDEEIQNAKLAMKNSLNSVRDSLSSTEDWYMSQLMCHTMNTPEEEASLVDDISLEDVKAAAEKIALDTIYFLTGKESVQE